MLLAPISQPQYVTWWLPALVAIVVLTERGYVALLLVSLAPLVFSIGILGPLALLAPLATYTHLIPATTVSDAVTEWYLSPGSLWGLTRADDYLAASALITVVAVGSLFVVWIRMAFGREEAALGGLRNA
jgi:hypothetical protein